MRTVFDAEHEDIRTTVRKLLQRDADPDDLVVDAATNGFLGIGVPEEYGGADHPTHASSSP
ncbi:acyl-CoA dehydrogenase family protein [Rhodococcus opacus]|nr:acyl-CoA dehydrogenase family protein [Rhodococcus opacus]